MTKDKNEQSKQNAQNKSKISAELQYQGPVFRMGFVVNPYAGVGGPEAFKGSDANTIQAQAIRGEIALRAPGRVKAFLDGVRKCADKIKVVTVDGAMGAEYFEGLPFTTHILDMPIPDHTHASDTVEAVRQIQHYGVDLLVFVGGDGTARDVCSAINEQQAVIGVPSGVKMHSGVYGVHPSATAEIVGHLAMNELMSLSEREVRDIDEDAFRKGIVRSKFYGEMLVPEDVRYVQQVKQGGVEHDELVLADIAADIIERIDELDDEFVIFAPGSTTQFVQRELGCEGTLLGVDVVQNRELIATDINAKDLLRLIQQHAGRCYLVLTAIGGQGHIIGRGNQQLSPDVLKAITKDNLWVISTKTKLKGLEGRPLLIDSNDAELDRDWTGYIPVITGYRDQVLYSLAAFAETNPSE